MSNQDDMSLREELEEAVKSIGLLYNEVLLENLTKESIISRIKQKFVKGNPRVLWLGFVEKPEFLQLEDEEEVRTFLISEFGESTPVYFLIEEDDFFLLKVKTREVVSIILECRYFEYYVVDEGISKLFGENDHGDYMFLTDT